MRWTCLIPFGLLAADGLTGQQLLNPNNWLRINPAMQRNYSATATGISFNPYCGTAPCRATDRTGIMQFVQLSKGLYQFRLEGRGGGTGTFETHVGLGSKQLVFRRDNWHVAQTVELPSGMTAIWITTDTSNLQVDVWTCKQPILTPVLAPSVDVDVANAADPNSVRVQLSTPGLILAGSLTSPTVPIPVPGLTHGLHLSPGSLVILGVSGSGGMTVDLTRAASRLGPNRWPMIYLQAVSRTGFGTRSWF